MHQQAYRRRPHAGHKEVLRTLALLVAVALQRGGLFDQRDRQPLTLGPNQRFPQTGDSLRETSSIQLKYTFVLANLVGTKITTFTLVPAQLLNRHQMYLCEAHNARKLLKGIDERVS